MESISSMTGFASVTENFNSTTINVDLRAVNHRNLDLQFRIPEEFRFLETTLRKQITKNISRGKIDCRVSLKNHAVNDKGKINFNVLDNINDLVKDLQEHFPSSPSPSAYELLKWPGVLEETEISSKELSQNISALISKALIRLMEEKRREGNSLKQILIQRSDRIKNLVKLLDPLIPNLVQKNKEKIIRKLEEHNLDTNSERIHQELVLYAAKIDVDEEIERIKVHLQEIENIVNQGGICGKKLDFLAQELNRETNTLSAKSVDLEITQVSIEIKTLIEQLREQIQNIE